MSEWLENLDKNLLTPGGENETMFEVVYVFYVIAFVLYVIALTKIASWQGQLAVVGFTFVLSCVLMQTNDQTHSNASLFAACFAWMNGFLFLAYLWRIKSKHNDWKKYLGSPVDIGRKMDFNEFFMNK